MIQLDTAAFLSHQNCFIRKLCLHLFVQGVTSFYLPSLISRVSPRWRRCLGLSEISGPSQEDRCVQQMHNGAGEINPPNPPHPLTKASEFFTQIHCSQSHASCSRGLALINHIGVFLRKCESVKNTCVTSHTSEPPSVTPPYFGFVKLHKLLV